MAAQLNYNYSTPKGIAGGKADIAFDEVVTRQNESEDGVMKYGMGVVKGVAAGHGVKVPGTASVAADFEGIVLHAENTEQDMKGKVVVKKNASLGIMKKGHVWARLDSGATATYGAKAYLIVDATAGEVGAFTDKITETKTIDVGAKFGNHVDAANGIAVIVL